MPALPNRPLKIALIHQPWSVIRPPVDGADSIALLIEEIARRLAPEHNVITYCRLGRGQQRVEEFRGVSYHRASVSVDRWVKLGMQALDRRRWRNPLRPFFSSSLCYRQFINEVIADLSKQRCDVVEIENFSQFAPLIRAKIPGIRIVLHMHCEWLNQLDAAEIERRIEAADLVLGCSDFIAEKTRVRFPHLAGRCRHVYNGASIEYFERPASAPPPAAGKQILFVGRLSPEKGVHTLLDAFRIVLEKHPDARLELIGPEQVVPYEMIIPFCNDPKLRAIEAYYRPGVYGELLREKIAQLPAGSVNFLNEGLKHTELVSHYHSAAVFALPSVWDEPFGMPLVEAMAAKAPVVATNGGAFPEIVDHGRTGLLVDRGNVQELADALLQMLSDETRRREMAEAGYARVLEMFTWERIAESLLNEYRRVLASDNRHATPADAAMDEEDEEANQASPSGLH